MALPDGGKFNFTPEEYQDLWLLALQKSSIRLRAKIENVYKSKGITDIDPAGVVTQLLEAAESHLAPPSEDEISALEEFISSWRSDGTPKGVAYNVIEKLVRSFHQHSNSLELLETKLLRVEEDFLDRAISKTKCLTQTMRDTLRKAEVSTNREFLALSKKDLKSLKLASKMEGITERLSYELAISYTQARKDIHKSYTQNLQSRAADKLRITRKKLTAE